jgi:hypothetical protein
MPFFFLQDASITMRIKLGLQIVFERIQLNFLRGDGDDRNKMK